MLEALVAAAVGVAVLVLVLPTLVLLVVRRMYFSRRTDAAHATIAFFHPYCAAGGGGERVLWCAIAALADLHDIQHARIIVYTGEPAAVTDKLLERVRANFGIEIPQRLQVEFVHVPGRELLEAARYPRFTMLGQSLGSVVYAWRALRTFTPDLFIDTTGYAFTFLVAKLLADCHVACYVHYPTITKEMIGKVLERRPAYNNPDTIASSQAMTNSKVAYYKFFAWLYSLMGGLTDIVMVNSSWTKNHVDSLWQLPTTGRSEESACYRPTLGMLASILRAFGLVGVRAASQTVFPPCNTSRFRRIPLSKRERLVVSLAQFRPEKDHALQLRAFALFLKKDRSFADIKLVVMGGARDDGDRGRVAALERLAAELGISNNVEFKVNLPLAEIETILGRATAGLHTMWNEHFGISVVEMMAAGIITIANNSGGPQADIVVDFHGKPTGFLARTPEEYADCLQRVFSDKLDLQEIARTARASTERFCDEEFSLAFYAAIIPAVLDIQRQARQRRREEGLSE